MTIHIYSLPHVKRKTFAYENKAEKNLSKKLKLRRSEEAKKSEVSSSSPPPQQKTH